MTTQDSRQTDPPNPPNPPNPPEQRTLDEFLRKRWEVGGFSTEDVLASFLPLVRQVLETHQDGQVAPLEGIADLRVAGVQIGFEATRRQPPRICRQELVRLERTTRGPVEIVGHARRTIDVDQGESQIEDLRVTPDDQPLAAPVYLPGYLSWEHRVGHHDPLTDVFALGLILASLGCGLDFNKLEDVQRFVAHRGNLFRLHPGLHPTLAQAIVRMTELNRHRRPQDLAALLHSLENYRDQDVEFQYDLDRIAGFGTHDLQGKQQIVLSRLQERLFDLSRRNRLLEFRPSMQSVNLTEASVPLSFDIRNVRSDQILTWNDTLVRTLRGGKPVSLNKYLNFKEALYLPSVLDRLRVDARRDQAEFGFAQLRLVACFLRWANLKQTPIEIYDSPLIMLPVELGVKKGIRDTYTLRLLATEAEVNPVLRHQFKQLYAIDLPEFVDLATTGLGVFFEFLSRQIQASEPGVQLRRIDRPRIELIHDRARRRVDQYRRRARLAGRGTSNYLDLDYSYDAANYNPLGIKLFSAKVRPPANHLRAIVESTPRPRQLAVPEPVSPPREPEQGQVREQDRGQDKERSFFTMHAGSDNPYDWEFDLCRVTLANLRYRKMSLVRDFTALLAEEQENPAFESTFSLVPRDTTPLADPPPLEERYHVVACDPTQAASIAQARQGRSYIIQGPPGTGKSQTITNLIADYVARGQRVLFVCEKRAAIDVVFLRLRQLGLQSLCCLIHDSQADKKEFVQDLKRTYEGFLATKDAPAKGSDHATLLERVRRDMQPLAEFHQAMLGSADGSEVALRELLEQTIQLRDRLPELSPLESERLPDLSDWWPNREPLEQADLSLRDLQPDGVFARHPLRLLRPDLSRADRPMRKLLDALPEADSALRRLSSQRDKVAWLAEHTASLDQLEHLVRYAEQAEPLARHGLVALLKKSSPKSRTFARQMQQVERCRQALQQASEETIGWRHKLSPQDVTAALRQARRWESNWLAFLQPAWWRLRSALRCGYDFSSHRIQPTWTQVLERLQREHEAQQAVEQAEDHVCQALGYTGSLSQLAVELDTLRQRLDDLPAGVRQLHDHFVKNSDDLDTLDGLLACVEPLAQLRDCLDEVLVDYASLDWDSLAAYLEGIEPALEHLPDFLHLLGLLAGLPPKVQSALRHVPLTRVGLEAAIADASVQRTWRENRELRKFNADLRRRQVERLEVSFRQWQQGNADLVRQRVRERFLSHVQRAAEKATAQGTSAGKARTSEEREFARRYNRGRRELEHEFGKSMRYKSIRDLVAGDSGEVVKDLKPVWLMSPLSVSDTLPLDTRHFDVVIFDEASQITLEEAVPSLFRARQSIVVGDEMQLPPTDFFASRQPVDEDPLSLDEQGELIEYDLSGNSFLNHAARNLPSCMLGWHYRSRSEALISFSNWAFYEGRLLTVPEEQLRAGDLGELLADDASDARRHAAGMLRRPLSFHFMRHGVYESRRNRAEAEYIAELVRELLSGEAGLSLGIVAFSEAQQQEIEAALDRLAQQDDAFRDRLEAEWERHEDGQFVGLLVKNLENIQGDERDVIVLSICYGPGPDGRMLMNFGPINKSGGEKRLNVAFTRARQHMVVVSSIHDFHITNDYNDGARCLRDYLRYAEAYSRGDLVAAQRVLHEQATKVGESPAVKPGRWTAVVQQLSAALRQRGYQVDADIGHSHFRCDLGVRADGDQKYRLGILVDNDQYYGQHDVLERELMRPRLLQAFGWEVAHVLAKDWYDDPSQVLAGLESRLSVAAESGR